MCQFYARSFSLDGSSAKGYLDGPRTVQAVDRLAALIKNKFTALYTDQWNNGYGYANDFPARSGIPVGYYYKLPEYLKTMGLTLAWHHCRALQAALTQTLCLLGATAFASTRAIRSLRGNF